MIEFPKGFLWGTATSSHQIEGGNWNNDWWEYEHDPSSGCAEPSGDACDTLHRWREDVDLVSSLGLGAYRFSLEWSRIEPEDGEWSLAALDYYRRICAACHGVGLTPVVTFNHFTLPRWLAKRGGWEAPEAPERFARFSEKVVHHFGDLIGKACTLNEPNVVAIMGYVMGAFPPGIKDDLSRHHVVTQAEIKAHRLCVEALRSGPGTFPVGLSLSMSELRAVEGGEAARDAAEEMLENVFLAATEGDDYIGVQCYTRMRFGANMELLGPEHGVPVTQMGYEFWPQALEYCVRRAAQVTKIPVLITENGIGTDDDADRISFVGKALEGVKRCLDDGIDVQGYFLWSLLDNFEWSLGYMPKFGMVGVDRKTFERRPKPSAFWFGEIAKTNTLSATS